MAVDNYVDLSTYSAVGAAAARIIIKTEWQTLMHNVERDEYCTLYKDYGAGYFNLRAQPIYFCFTCARRPYVHAGMAGINWVANNDPSGGTVENVYLKDNAAADGVGLWAYTSGDTLFGLYLVASRGGSHFATVAQLLTLRDSNLPLYAMMYQTDTTYYVLIYDQPKYEADHLLYTFSLAVAGSGSDTFRYHIPLCSHNSGNTGYQNSFQYGNCYLGGSTPPDMFYVSKTHFLIDPDDSESFSNANWPTAGDLGWMKSEPDGAGCTAEYESVDGYDTGHIAYVAGSKRITLYAATSVTTLIAGEKKVLFKLNSMSDGDHCPIFGLMKEATPEYLAAEVVRSGDHYYWRLAKHQSGARTEGSQTRYECTPGTWYELVISIQTNSNGTPMGILYVKEVGGAAVAVESQAKTRFAPTRCYLAYIGGVAAADCSGDFNVTLLDYQNGHGAFPSIEKYGSTLFASHRVTDQHACSSFNTDHLDIFRSTDNNGTWQKVYTFAAAAGVAYQFSFIRYNAVTASWWIYICYCSGSDSTIVNSAAYEVTDAAATPITVALRATWDTAPSKFRCYPTRIVDGDGKVLMGMIYVDSDDIPGTNRLDMCWFDAAGDYSLDSQVTIAEYGDYMADNLVDEPSFYYKDDGDLVCVARWEQKPIPAINARYVASEASGDDGATWPDDPATMTELIQAWAGKPQLFTSGDYLYGQFYNCRTASTSAYKSMFAKLDRETGALIQAIGLYPAGSIACGNGDCAVDSSGDESYAYMATDYGSGGFVFEILVDELPKGGGGSVVAKLMALGAL